MSKYECLNWNFKVSDVLSVKEIDYIINVIDSNDDDDINIFIL